MGRNMRWLIIAAIGIAILTAGLIVMATFPPDGGMGTLLANPP